MKLQNHSRRGYALIAVLGVIVLLLVYLVAVQGTVQQTRIDGKRVMNRQVQALGEASALAMAIHDDTATTLAKQVPLATADDGPATVTWRLLMPDDPVWSGLPVMPLAGDRLVEIQWKADGEVSRYIVNGREARKGAIRLK